MTIYWRYAYPSPPPAGRSPVMVSTPPHSSYYSPRVAPYTEAWSYPDRYRDQSDDWYHDVSREWERALIMMKDPSVDSCS